ncbi:unnamed protein product [Diatraea saccharalis]|uniref:AAA+ ATPase domain-containing protein n=1 Tax=Diatraea saccharalis TaxID=40085 RepID=A0A9N9QZA7_9NEOP|nr:unnamed protein product [Diatraea saccharalis]
MTCIKYFLLTGEPGVGKTTLTKKLNQILRSKGIKTAGFFTEEVRQNRVREGFDIVTLEGQRGRLARDVSLLCNTVKFKVGKYGVLVQEFEKIALPALLQQDETEPYFLIIDEIGKMEFFSNPFKARVQDIFSSDSTFMVLATIPLRASDRLIESIRHNTKSKVWTVSCTVK